MSEQVKLYLQNKPSLRHPKLCGNCASPQNFHTRKLGEMKVFFAVSDDKVLSLVIGKA